MSMHDRESLSKPVVAVFFLVLLLLRLRHRGHRHPRLVRGLPGGVIMPVNMRFRNIFIDKVEDVATGAAAAAVLRVHRLAHTDRSAERPGLWNGARCHHPVAVAGKFLGSALAARFVGRQLARQPDARGALMNTRGLMELVVLNIGYDLGVMSPEIFAMMVIMALVTTFMTGPFAGLIERLSRHTGHPTEAERGAEARRFKVLVPSVIRNAGRTWCVWPTPS
jgi:hypothetical protein